MEAVAAQVALENGENKEENNEQKEKPVEQRGGKREDNPSQEKPFQSWPRPLYRPQQYQQEQYNRGQSQEQRKAVTFGPPVRNNCPPENRPQGQQGVVFRRPSPWAVLRAKLPTGDNVPVLRPGITNEHFIQRMQNPEAARPPSRPPMSRPGSQESVRPPYIQRSDSVVGRPPASPRPPSRTSSSSKDEDEDVEVRSVPPQSGRPPSGQRAPGSQNIQQNPTAGPTNHQPPNVQSPQMTGQSPPRTQQGPLNPQNQNPLPQNRAPSQMTSQPMTQAQIPSQNKAQIPNQSQGPPVQGPMSRNPPSQQAPQHMQQNQTPMAQPQLPSNDAQGSASVHSSPPSTGPQTPVPQQNTVPSSPVATARPSSARNPIQPSPSKARQPQKQDVPISVKDESAPEAKMSQDKINHNDTTKERNENLTNDKMSVSQDKTQNRAPIIVDATLKRPNDFIGPSQLAKVEETDKTAKENEPPRPESSKKENTSAKVQEPAVVNGNHESPKKSKTAPPKKLGTAQSPLKSPNKPQPKTPETPGTADKKKVPMNKVQVGAAPSPNLKSVKSKIGSLENAKHKPGGGHVKIEHRKLNFNVAPKIEAKNDTYSPGGGDKKIQQVKLQWNAKPKVGSLDNAAHKPGGGDKKIESVKLDFKEKAKPKVGSKDNIKHVAGGGTVKIEDQKLEVKAQSKIGSLENVKHRPGGGDKKIFDDKDYLKQMASTSTDSLNQERKKRSRCNSTSSQDSKYKSDDKTSSRQSLKSDGQKEQSKEKSPQRPTDQNYNQVSEKILSETQLKTPKSEHDGNIGHDKSHIQTNGINYQDVKKDANGNGKIQETVNNVLTNNAAQQKALSKEIYENQNSNSKGLDNKQPLTNPLSPDDKKPPIKPMAQPHNIPANALIKEQTSSINSDCVSNQNQSRPNIHRPLVDPPSQNQQKNLPGLPLNVRLARDLINDTYKNEREPIVEKSLTEKTEKETTRLLPNISGQTTAK